MKACPNINSPEWKELEAAVGRFEAMKDWMEHNGEIRSANEVLSKIIGSDDANSNNTQNLFREDLDYEKITVKDKIAYSKVLEKFGIDVVKYHFIYELSKEQQSRISKYFKGRVNPTEMNSKIGSTKKGFELQGGEFQLGDWENGTVTVKVINGVSYLFIEETQKVEDEIDGVKYFRYPIVGTYQIPVTLINNSEKQDYIDSVKNNTPYIPYIEKLIKKFSIKHKGVSPAKAAHFHLVTVYYKFVNLYNQIYNSDISYNDFKADPTRYMNELINTNKELLKEIEFLRQSYKNYFDALSMKDKVEEITNFINYSYVEFADPEKNSDYLIHQENKEKLLNYLLTQLNEKALKMIAFEFLTNGGLTAYNKKEDLDSLNNSKSKLLTIAKEKNIIEDVSDYGKYALNIVISRLVKKGDMTVEQVNEINKIIRPAVETAVQFLIAGDEVSFNYTLRSIKKLSAIKKVIGIDQEMHTLFSEVLDEINNEIVLRMGSDTLFDLIQLVKKIDSSKEILGGILHTVATSKMDKQTRLDANFSIDQTAVILHELGHALEYFMNIADPNIKKAYRGFIEEVFNNTSTEGIFGTDKSIKYLSIGLSSRGYPVNDTKEITPDVFGYIVSKSLGINSSLAHYKDLDLIFDNPEYQEELEKIFKKHFKDVDLTKYKDFLDKNLVPKDSIQFSKDKPKNIFQYFLEWIKAFYYRIVTPKETEKFIEEIKEYSVQNYIYAIYHQEDNFNYDNMLYNTDYSNISDVIGNNYLSYNGDRSLYDNRYTAVEDSISLNVEETNNTRGKEIVEKLLNTLRVKYPQLEFPIITSDEALAIVRAAGTAYNGEPAFFLNGKVYIVQDRLSSTEILFHELSHPILRSMFVENEELFNNLYESLEMTPEGQAIVEEVKANYPELEPGSTLFKEEVLAMALGRTASNTTESPAFTSFINKLLFAIRQFFRKLFKSKIAIEKLKADTTLNELADMLKSEEFIIKTELVNQSDLVSFIKSTREELIDDLNNLEKEDMLNLANKFESSSRAIKNLVQSSHYKDLRDVLKDPLNRSDLSEIASNLTSYREAIEPLFNSAQEEIEYANKMAGNVLNSLIRLESVSTKVLKNYRELSMDTDNKENLSKIMYYNTFITGWMNFLNKAKEVITEDKYYDKISHDNPILELINGIISNFQGTKKYAEKVAFDGTSTTLIDELQSMSEVIDNMYETLIKNYRDKGAPEALIKQYEKEYSLVKVTPEKIKALLKGELGDSHPLNSFMEGYMRNQDPVIFGFAKYVKGNYINMTAKVQQQLQEFSREVEDLMTSAGYTTALSRIKTMGEDLLFKDIKSFDEEGNPKTYYTFLNPWKDFESDRSRLEDIVEKAKEKKLTENTPEAIGEYQAALDELTLFNKMMHREYTKEYYDRFELLGMYDPSDVIGIEANRRMKNILNDIQMLQTNIQSIDQALDNYESIKMLWRKYKNLASKYNSDGSLKTDPTEISIAERIAEYRKASKGIYTFKSRPGLFESSYKNFIQSLKDQGLSEEDIQEKRVKWLTNNTVIKYTKAFYDERAELYSQLAELDQSDDDKRIIELYAEKNTIISAYKNEDGQSIAVEMEPSLLVRILEIDKEIKNITDKPDNKIPLSKSDLKSFVYYRANISSLTKDEIIHFNEIKAMLNKRKNKNFNFEHMLAKKEIFAKLSDLSNKVLSDDYVEVVNSMLNDEIREFLKKNINAKEFSNSDIEYALDPKFIEFAKKHSKSYEKWFNKNHVEYTYGKGRKAKTFYKASSAWSYTKPKDTSHYETTIIYDDAGNPIEEILGVPNLNYFYRVVNEEYTTEKLTMLDCIEQGLPLDRATVDMQGRFLPNYQAKNQKYFNEDFYKLQSTSPNKYKLLIALIKNHLTYQRDTARDSRLNLELPRYRKDNLETFTSRDPKDIVKTNPLVVWAKQVRDFFGKRADDFERGLNPEEMNTLVNTDLYDDEFSKVPITGMYDLENDLTSIDITRSMMRYMQSTVKQKTLIDMLPMARSLQSLVQNPDNNARKALDDAKGYSFRNLMSNSLLHFGKSKDKSIRAQAINAFIEREFEGKSQAGFLRGMSTVNKVTNQLFGLSSTAFFAFNIPAALKNSLGARFQSLIEASAGKNFSWSHYVEGSHWAAKTTMEISYGIYSNQAKSVDFQLVELMDPSQGRFEGKVSQGVNTTRNMLSDAAELGFTTSIRKWTELNATLSVFGAMLKKTKLMHNGKEITYDEAWEVRDGVIQLKEGIDSTYDKGGQFFKEFVNKVHGIVYNLNGAYSKMDQPNANRYLLFRFIMFMKNYFVPLFMNRFQARWDPNNKKIIPRYNADLNTLSKGFYVEFLQMALNTVKMKGKNLPYLNNDQKIATKKVVTEVGMLVIIQYVIAGLLFGWDPDDEERYEKLRDKSGSLPLPFVVMDDAHPFHVGGWFSNNALNLALQVKDENDAWIPLPGLGLKDYTNMLSFESVSLNATLGTYQELLSQLVSIARYNINGDTRALYKRDVGPYEWQQEGSFKFFNHLAKLFTLSGTTVDPTLAIRKLQNRQSRQ